MASPWARAWPRAAAGAASWALGAAVFAFLDVLDVVLCLVYALLDGILEESPVRCYCHRSPPDDGDDEVSDTLYLYARPSAVRDALLGLVRRVLVVAVRNKSHHKAAPCKWWGSPRWSDCGCKSCVAWRSGAGRLHVVAKEPDKPRGASGTEIDDETATTENAAIFIHGFTSSSSFWAETVFRESSSAAVLNSSRLFAVDLLGFGQSPKPADCLYRLRDHVEAIDTSLIETQHNLESFHLVAHSMGCIIALALAAKHPTRVKSITLVAPPYFPPCEHKASQVALTRLAGKKLWPPLLFGSAVMSWYEHVACFVVCKNHRLWEWLYTLLTRSRDVDFRVRDLTRHTHHSGWHTMHNVICGGATLQDRNLEAVQAAGIPVMLVHGVDDAVVPAECSSRHLKAKLPRAELRLIAGRDHATVVSGRKRAFAEDLAAFWSGSQAQGQGARRPPG
ncbi:unnamed protein product [Urochloa humidicola]